MRAMKDSGIEWIGRIPHDWQVSKMKHIGEYINGYAFKPSQWGTEGKQIIRIQDLTQTSDQPNYYDGELDAKYLVKTGDLLISWAATLDAFVWKKDEAWLNQHIFKAIPKESVVCKPYFYWLIKEAMLNMNNGNKHGIMMQHVTYDVFDNFAIPLPDLGGQEKIAKFLEEKCAEIDTLIAAKEKTNALLKERRQSIIYEAVTKGLDPDASMKDSGIEWIGQIPEHWAVERLKPHIDFNPKTVIPEYEEDDSVSFIPMDCLRRGVHTTQTVDYSKVKSGYVVFAGGDILMAKVTPCLENGNLAVAGNLIDGVGFGSTEINVIRCMSIHREYLFYILQCKTYVDRAVADMYGVAGLKRLNPSFIPNTKYPMPSIAEQEAIAAYLDQTCGEIDELVVANEKTIEKLKEYRQSIIYEAVTGKIEV